MKTDSLFYRLFQRMPGLALELAGLACPAEGYVFRSEEIKQTAFRLDGLLVPAVLGPRQPLVFVEVQFWPDPGFYLRFCSEVLLYLRQHPAVQDWRAVVIYPGRGAEVAPSGWIGHLVDWPLLRRVYLEDFGGVADGGLSWTARSLVSLIQCPEREALSLARQLAQRPGECAPLALSRQEWLDFIETILVYKLPRLSREEIQRMIGLQDVELKQTRFYQDVFAEGCQEGLEKGRQEGEFALVSRLLQRRFGPLLSADLSRRVQALPLERLEALAEALLDFSGPQDLADWLDAQGDGV